MENNNIFSVKRFVLLVKRHYTMNYKELLIAYLGIAGLFALIGALSSIGKASYNVLVLEVLFSIAIMYPLLENGL